MAAPAPSSPLAPAPAPAQARARTPTRAPAPRPRVAAPTRTRSSATAATAASLATAGHGSASSAVAGPARAASAAQAAKDERPLPAAVLPEPLRSRVAALVFGGAVQSQERRQSFVLMAGRIVREGEALAPGIVLERIGARSLLLRVDGQAVDLPL
jgi:general secretion pathway protein B